MLLFMALTACVETIEVGSKLEEAREAGELPEAMEGPGALTGAQGDQLPQLLLDASSRNLRPEALEELLESMGVPAALREDTLAYVERLRDEGVSLEELPAHAAAFVLERHDPDQRLQQASESELLELGLAFALQNETALRALLIEDSASRLQHCHHEEEGSLLLSSYAQTAVETLQSRGFRCRGVRLGEKG